MKKVADLILKSLLAVLLGVAPAHAWTFTPGPICELTHTEASTTVTLTYDPGAPLYTISNTRPDALPTASTFAIRFDGPQPIQIGTDRHTYDAANTTLTVSDSGFGNVLNGLQFNDSMSALIGDETLSVSLEGAAAPTAAFRACEGPQPSV